MKRCEKCGVQFSGDLDRCPLCQAELSGDASPAVFPRNEVRKSGAIALAVLAFATGACCSWVICSSFRATSWSQSASASW